MSADPLIGRIVAGHRIDAMLGKGAMGVVYRVTHVQLNRTRALKLLPAHLAGDRAFRDRFEREWRLAAMIEHPNIVEVLDAGQENGQLYIVMRYVEGADLTELIRRHGSLDPARTLRILEQVAGALDAAHARGLVHRDVKPSNILVGPDDRSYLSDFGIAKSGATRGLTQPGAFLGTIDYAAPEQFEGGELDGRTDVYSLGGVLFACLTGAPPYERDTDAQVMHAHLLEPAPRPTERRPDIPLGVDRVIATAMEKRKERRYQSAGALVTAFRAALETPATIAGAGAAETVLAGAATIPVPPPPAPRRARTGLLAVGLVLATALAAGVVAAVLLSGDGEPTATPTTAGEQQPGTATEARTESAGGARAVAEQLVVAPGEDLYVVDPGRGDLSKLTGGRDRDGAPACSSDGRRLAFARNGDIFVMTRAGGDRVNLTNSPERENAPAWSPDGRLLAFDRQSGDGTYDVWIMRADGSDQQNLTGGQGESGGAPEWSPDGSRIVFQQKLALWVMRRDGAGKQILTGDSPGSELQASWAPGERIAYARFEGPGGSSDIFVMRSDGSGKTNVTRGTSSGAKEPVWSPDGTRIAFANEEGLWVIGAEGAGLRSVARVAGLQRIAWCPRGSSG